MTSRALALHPVIFRKPAEKTADISRILADPETRLAEIVGLSHAINLDVINVQTIRLDRPRPATLFGKGVIERLANVIKVEKIDLTVVDAALTPIQQRNLEKALSCKVIDRTGLILEIFGERARTKEGVLQVELAALSYQKSRLVRSWTHLERQRGGFGFMGGPGESQIESDRRQISERITRLKRELEEVKRTRALHRQARKRVPYPVVALVGYTNAGKSTLFNRLTKSEVYAEDLLFATLDPTMRGLRLPSGQEIILSDTVGFISDLPTTLVAAFRATLEEVIAADIVVHVRDIAHIETESQKSDVLAVLADLGLDPQTEDTENSRGWIEVWNKTDLIEDKDEKAAIETRAARSPESVALSALTGTGCDDLLALIDSALAQRRHLGEFTISLAEGAPIAWLYSHGRVETRFDTEEHAHLTVSLENADLARFAKKFPGCFAAIEGEGEEGEDEPASLTDKAVGH